jgi:hypothetical protein
MNIRYNGIATNQPGKMLYENGDDYPVARTGIPCCDNSLFQLSSSLPRSPAMPL